MIAPFAAELATTSSKAINEIGLNRFISYLPTKLRISLEITNRGMVNCSQNASAELTRDLRVRTALRAKTSNARVDGSGTAWAPRPLPLPEVAPKFARHVAYPPGVPPNAPGL